MDPARPNLFAGPFVDRRCEAREDPGWAGSARADPQTLFLLNRGTGHLIQGGEQPRIAFLDGSHPAVAGADPARLVLLGWFRQRRCVLVEIDPDTAFEPPNGASFDELRALSPQLAGDEAGLLAYARALTLWRARQRFCGACGAATRPERAGHSLRCSQAGCGQEFFPRLDPAIIVLVCDGERALLGRQASWAPGRYSTIAGFVEPGESLEDAVAREVMEETGVPVDASCYDSSQPWPFPASLMIGFRAVARPGSPARGIGELQDARWLTRAEVRAGAVTLPPAHSISHRLIGAWLDED